MYDRALRLIEALTHDLSERQDAASLGLLALCAGESLFLLGPPGVAKSLLARRFKTLFRDGRSFEYLMGRFSTPEDLFGPLSLSGLRDHDVFVRKTEGYLPEADVVFLDELWRAGPPIQNTLLAILNEKLFRNGSEERRVPLKLLIGASNTAPDGEENSEAFWDRFLLRLELAPVASGVSFQSMLARSESSPPLEVSDPFDETDWQNIQHSVSEVRVPSFIPEAFDVLRDNLAPAYISDRRWRKALRLLKASAFLHDRVEVDPLDLAVLKHVLWHTPSERDTVQQRLLEVLDDFGWEAPAEVTILLEAPLKAAEALKALTKREEKISQPRPVLYDGEYYAVKGYPGSLSARVWARDYDLWTAQEEAEGELFFFRPLGSYAESRKVSVQRGDGPAEIVLDGVLYALESVSESVTVWKETSPEPKAMKAWTESVSRELQQLKTARERVDNLTRVKVADGERHLFADQAQREACRASLDRLAARLQDAETALRELQESRKPNLG